MKVTWRGTTIAVMFIAFSCVALSTSAYATGNGQCRYNCPEPEQGVNIENDNTNHNHNSNDADARADASSRSSSSSGASSDSTGVGVGVGLGGSSDATGGDSNAGVDHSGNSRNEIDSEVNQYANDYNTDNSINVDDNDVYVGGDTDNSSFIIPAHAAAGYSNNLIVDCQRILGFDFRGSGTTQAGGASFGVPLPGGACKLEKATLHAFSLGNYEMGWMLYCAQKPVWKGYRTTAQALHGTKLTKDDSIRKCFATAKVVDAPTAQQVVISEVTDHSNYASKDELERAFIATQTK